MSYTTGLGISPAFTISKSGEDITSRIADRLLSIKVESREGGGDADIADITIDDRDWNITSPSIGEGSASLQISMGYVETVLYDMGTFQVDDLHYLWTPKAMLLHGNSLGFTTAAKAPIIAAYDGKTLGDIVGSIAAAASVTPKVDPALAAIAVPYLNQNSSSMHLLQELERRFGALAKFGDGMLSFTKRGTGLAASGASIGSFVLGLEDFGPNGCDIGVSNRQAYSKVRASWWDKVNHQLQWITSATASNPNASVPFMMKHAFNSEAEAQAAADSHMAQLNRKTKQGTIILAKGDPSIRGGQGFAIAGCREGIDGSYLVRLASHMLTKAGGIVTTLDVYDEGDGVDFAEQSTDGKVDLSGVPASTVPANGVSHN